VSVSDFAAAQVTGGDVCRVRVHANVTVLSGAKVERARRKIEMTASRHRYHGYELVLQRKDDDRYQVTIFDPKGKRTASTGIHLERQGALNEASQYISQLLAKRRASLSIS
jgi:hypothetical protein